MGTPSDWGSNHISTATRLDGRWYALTKIYFECHSLELPPNAGEMNQMTLLTKYRIQNSNQGGLRLSTLPLGHGGFLQY